MPPLRSASALLVVVALALGAAPIATADAHGVLSKAEFQQLQLAEKRIKSLSAKDTRGLKQGESICRRMRQVSPLIGAVRSGCLDLITLGQDNGRLNASATRCGIDPPSQAAVFTCLIPAVQRYYSDAERFYLAENRVVAIARERGFGSGCIAVIGDTPGNIAAEGRLAADLKAAVVALRHQNPDTLQTLSASIEKDANSIRPGPSSLSLCPHQ